MAGTFRGNALKLAGISLCLLLDFLISTALLIHGNDFSRFSSQIAEFKFCSASFDLWIVAVIRLALLIGAVVGLLRNRKDAIPRLKASTKLVFYFAFMLVIYVVVKFLVSTECSLERTLKIWLWCFAGYTVVGSCILIGCWKVLSNIKLPSNLSTEEEFGDVLERERLLDSNEDGTTSDNETKDDGNKKSPSKTTVSIWKLLSFSKPDLGYILLALFFLLSACTAQIFIPYYTGEVIDGIAIEKDRKKFEAAILTMSLIALVEAISAGLRGGIFSYVCARFNIRVNNRLFGSILSQEVGFFDNMKTGEIISRLTSDTTKMSDQVTFNVNVFLRNIIKGIGVCIFMFKLSWQLTVVTLIGLPLIAFVSEVYGDYYRKLSTAVQDSVAKANEVAAEVVSSMKTVRSFANEDGELNRYKRKNHEVFKLKVKEAILLGGYSWCTEILMLAMEVVILYYGGHLVLRGDLTGGNLVSFILYQLELTFCLEEIGEVYTGLMEAVGAAQKVFKLIDRRPKILNDGKIKPMNCLGRIEFQNVSFSYPTRPDVPILENVSFKIQPGQVVAFVGPSGGGKSTCINLLEHFYEPSLGDILIDSVSVRKLDHKYLHKVVSLVGQEPVLFARSVKDNIAYGMEHLAENMETIEHVASLANAHSFITEMPEGYNTETGEKGMQLSGGQKQRVAIARSLIRNPQILLLDEATSALDAESEHLVQDAIYRNLQGHTVLIIAHRLSTIEKADVVIVIDKGQVVEQGTHVELVEKDGLYNRLVQRQLVGNDSKADSSISQSQDLNPIRQRGRQISDDLSLSSESYSNGSFPGEGAYSKSPRRL